jgi:hypothetical protein
MLLIGLTSYGRAVVRTVDLLSAGEVGVSFTASGTEPAR